MKFQVDQEEGGDTFSQTSLFSVPQDSPFQGKSIMIALINDERFLQSFFQCKCVYNFAQACGIFRNG